MMGAEVVLAAVGLWLVLAVVLGALIGKGIHWGASDDAVPPGPPEERDWRWPPRGRS